MPHRVLLLVTDLGLGGAPLLVHSLATGLRDRGWNACVACLAPPGAVAERLARDGIVVHSAHAAGPADLLSLVRLGEILHAVRPDVLQTFLVHANVTGRVLGRMAHVPVVISEICTAEHGVRWHLAAERRTARLADAVVCNSPSVQAHMLAAGLPPARLTVIEHGIDLPRFTALDPQARPAGNTVLFVGRLDPVKGLDTLADAWPRVLAARPEAKLLIAGDGPLRPRLAKLPATTLLGFVDDIPALLSAADVFVLPSRWEGFGLAAAEAMAAARPVVLTAVDGLRDLVSDGVDGRLVPPGDAAALAAALVDLLGDAAQRARLGAAARTTAVRRFDRGRMVDQHAALYHAQLMRRR